MCRSPKVVLYSAKKTPDGGFEMTELQQLSVDGPVCAVTFDDEGRLWLLADSPFGYWLRAYTVSGDTCQVTI